MFDRGCMSEVERSNVRRYAEKEGKWTKSLEQLLNHGIPVELFGFLTTTASLDSFLPFV